MLLLLEPIFKSNMNNIDNTDFYEDMLNRYQKLNNRSVQVVEDKFLKGVTRGRNTHYFKVEDEYKHHSQKKKYASFPKKDTLRKASKKSLFKSKSRYYKTDNGNKYNEIGSPLTRSIQNSKSKSNSPIKSSQHSHIQSPTNPQLKIKESAILNNPLASSSLSDANTIANQLQNLKDMSNFTREKNKDSPLKESLIKRSAKQIIMKSIKKSKADIKSSIIVKKFQNLASDKSVSNFNISGKISEASKILLNALSKRKTAMLEIQRNLNGSVSKSGLSVRSKSVMNFDFSNHGSSTKPLVKKGKLLCCI